jgi:hypothetical protein
LSRVLLIIVLIVLPLAPGTAQAQGPRFVGRAGTSHLWLPPAMLAAVRATDSAFVPYDDAEFRADLLKWYPANAHARPYAVIADFNGDGRRDLVVDGQSRGRSLRIALLSSRSGFKGLLLDEQPQAVGTAAALPKGQRTVYLSYVAPGRIDSTPELEDSVLTLRHEAFEVGYWEQAGVLYYWDGRAFAQYVTGD